MAKAKKKAPRKPARKATTAKAPRKTAGKYVYFFGSKTDGNGSMKPLLGGKGANLAEMCRIGLPVPPGFTITTEVCTYYYDQQAHLSAGASGADGSGDFRDREADGQEVRRSQEPAARVGPLRRA